MGKNNVYLEGNIWMTELPKGNWSVQHGYRPVVIISNDKNNVFSDNVTVVPLTGSQTKKDLPTHTVVHMPPSDVWGFKSSLSVALGESVMTLSKYQLHRHIGRVLDEELDDIRRAVCVQLGIKVPENLVKVHMPEVEENGKRRKWSHEAYRDYLRYYETYGPAAALKRFDLGSINSAYYVANRARRLLNVKYKKKV